MSVKSFTGKTKNTTILVFLFLLLILNFFLYASTLNIAGSLGLLSDERQLNKLDLISALSSDKFGNEITALKLLQLAAQRPTTTAIIKHDNDDIPSLKKVVLIEDRSAKSSDTQPPKTAAAIDANYRNEYVRGLNLLGFYLTETEESLLNSVTTQKDFLKFHKAMLLKHKKPKKTRDQNLVDVDEDPSVRDKLSSCSVFE